VKEGPVLRPMLFKGGSVWRSRGRRGAPHGDRGWGVRRQAIGNGLNPVGGRCRLVRNEGGRGRLTGEPAIVQAVVK
jgi:hypothetical protein